MQPVRTPAEEEIILAAHAQLCAKNPDTLLIIVPRHPDRFDSVAHLCTQSFATVRRSQQTPCQADTRVYVGDTMGELLLLYAAADAAFVGGQPHCRRTRSEKPCCSKTCAHGAFTL